MDEMNKLRWANANLTDTLKRLRRWATNDPTGPVDAHNVSRWVVSVIDHGLAIGDPAMLVFAPSLAPSFTGCAMTAGELYALIGTPMENTHPDEWLPRAETWHRERLNWIKEVCQL